LRSNTEFCRSSITVLSHTSDEQKAREDLREIFFTDCTDEGTVGFLADADFEISTSDHQGASNLWNEFDAAHTYNRLCNRLLTSGQPPANKRFNIYNIPVHMLTHSLMIS